MNDIFEPQAQPMTTITNFENGKTFAPMDVFRNLFNRNATSISLFSNKGDEWEQERAMREELNQMIFGTWHSIGSLDGGEPTEEQIKKYTSEAAEMIHFMLYNPSSPLQIFKKSWRQFFVQFTSEDVKLKTLNVEKLEEFFDIGITNDARRFAEAHYLAGESQDWYTKRLGDGSTGCFEETQILCLVRYIKMVLNIYSSCIDLAEDKFKEGQSSEDVRESVSARCAGVEGILEVAIAEAYVEEAEVYIYKVYGDYCVQYDTKNVPSDSPIFKCKNMVEGRKYAKLMNAKLTAERLKRNNEKEISELQASLERELAKVEYLTNQESKATEELEKLEALVSLSVTKD